MASELHLQPAELRGMVRRGADAADLLLERMHALHLDAERVARGEPAVMRDLERLCSICPTKRRCRKELARNPQDPVWREHCLNEGTLIELVGGGAAEH